MNTDYSDSVINLIGAGGHCKVVYDAMSLQKFCNMKVNILDQSEKRCGATFLGKLNVQMLNEVELNKTFIHVTIGDNSVRRRLYLSALESGGEGLSIAHPTASVSGLATLKPGVFAAAHSVVGADAKIGEAVIINHNAVVDHDCYVGDFTHISPHTTLGGGVKIGENVLIGANATILPNVQICSNVIVAAGAIVTRSIDKPGVYIGSPAKFVRKF